MIKASLKYKVKAWLSTDFWSWDVSYVHAGNDYYLLSHNKPLIKQKVLGKTLILRIEALNEIKSIVFLRCFSFLSPFFS